MADKITLGASRFASAMGIGSGTSRIELYRQLVEGKVEEVSTFSQMLRDWGNDKEADAVAYAEAASGEIWTETGDFQHVWESDCGRYSCHPDGISDTAVLEVKCRKPDMEAYPTVPIHFMPQLQGEMWLCNRPFGVFACWLPGKGRSRCWYVERSNKYIAYMRAKLMEFTGYLDGIEEIPAKASKSRTIKELPPVKIELIDGEVPKCDTPMAIQNDCMKKIANAKTHEKLCAVAQSLATDYPDAWELIDELFQAKRSILDADPVVMDW